MELVEYEALPCSGEFVGGISHRAEQFGADRGTFRSVAEQLVLAVVEFHGGLRCVAACAMHVHQQLAVVERELGMFVVWQEVFEYLVAGGAYDLYGTVTADTALNGVDRGDRGGAAYVACAVVAVNHVQGSFLCILLQRFVVAEVFQLPAAPVVVSVSHHYSGTVHAAPEADCERITAVTVIERVHAPSEFLR